MNEVVLKGFADLPTANKMEVVRHCMYKNNWAKGSKKMIADGSGGSSSGSNPSGNSSSSSSSGSSSNGGSSSSTALQARAPGPSTNTLVANQRFSLVPGKKKEREIEQFYDCLHMCCPFISIPIILLSLSLCITDLVTY